MKKYILSSVFIMLCFSGFTQNLNWAKSIGGGADDQATGVGTDDSGNVYMVGAYGGTTDANPGSGTYNLTAAGDRDIMIVKMDKDGNFIWAKSVGGSLADFPYDVAISNEGNIHIVGTFRGTADFDPSGNVVNLTSQGSDDAFILKLDSGGNFIWVTSFGTSTSETGVSIAIDTVGNVYTTGIFQGVVDFDPSASVVNLTSAGAYDAFILKLNSSGSLEWARNIGGTSNDLSFAVAVNDSGSVYATGSFYGTADFNPGTGIYNITASGFSDIFIIKLSSSGNFVWAKNIATSNTGTGFSIAVDHAGYLYSCGQFSGMADFDPGPGTYSLTSNGFADIFVCKWNASGNVVWAERTGGSLNDCANSICLDGSGNIYTTGTFSKTVDFNPGIGIDSLVSNGRLDVFISKLDSTGNFVWAKSVGGSIDDDYGDCLTIDRYGSVYAGGSFNGTVDFDPGSSVYNLSSASSTDDMFVLKLNSVGLLPVSLLHFDAAKIENDVYLTWQTASEINADKFILERSIDGKNFVSIGEVKAAGNSTASRSYFFIDKDAGKLLPNSVLYYRFKQIDMDGQYTFSPIRTILFDEKPVLVTIFPNPTAQTLFIQVNNPSLGAPYFVTDVNGVSVLTGKLTDKTTSVDISRLPAGVYFMNINDADVHFKVVKQ